ncbi:hypothetical protein BDC45DRAFT_611137 [Circinella umbellata]|nr:hypothetical protein BDC45DRAFT_611137 [Circinella umbellata]
MSIIFRYRYRDYYQFKIIFFLFSILLLQQNVYAIGNNEEEKETLSVLSAGFWGQVLAIFALVICSGIVAGLTLGLMSLDATNLAILSTAGTPKQQKHAAKILPIRKNAHLLLTSLLLTNTVLNETLPILCDGLFGEGYVAVIISTALVFIFAEIIPQAICSRHGLAIGAFFAIPVRILIGFWYILAWPIAKLLDCILGKHDGTIYGVSELRELIHLHSEEKPLSLNNNNKKEEKERKVGGPLQKDTVEILHNTLDLSLYSASDFIHSTQQQEQEQSFMLPIDTQLDNMIINTILQNECINIPVYKYDPSSHCRIILGVLKTKYLSVLNPKDKIPLNKITIEPIKQVSANTSAITLLKILENDPNRMVQVVLSTNSPHNMKDNNTFKYNKELTTTIDEKTKDLGQKDLKIESSSSFSSSTQQPSSSICSSSESSHHKEYVSYTQDVKVLGIITFEELLNKLIKSNIKEETLLTNILIHDTNINEKDNADNKRSSIRQEQPIYHHSPTTNNNIKNEKIKGCCSSSSTDSESTVISKPNSINS